MYALLEYLKLMRRNKVVSSNKKVLFIDLEKYIYETKSFPDLKMFMGGFGLGLKLLELYEMANPVIFSIGPLNGFFPYVSKTCVLYSYNKINEDVYLGGSLSSRIKYADLDAIVLIGKADEPTTLDIQNNTVNFIHDPLDQYKLGLPGKRSNLYIEDNNLLIDRYFIPPNNHLTRTLQKKNVLGFTVTGSKNFEIENPDDYQDLYQTLLNKTQDITQQKGFFPSCTGCPIGCEKSNLGELGSNILVNCLVACAYSEKIYSDVGTVFSCLNVMSYDYKHEDIENLPRLIQNTLERLSLK